MKIIEIFKHRTQWSYKNLSPTATQKRSCEKNIFDEFFQSIKSRKEFSESRTEGDDANLARKFSNCPFESKLE